MREKLVDAAITVAIVLLFPAFLCAALIADDLDPADTYKRLA